MLNKRNNTMTDFQFKVPAKQYEPFPPAYYENEKRFKEILAQMNNPELKKRLQ